MSTIGKNTLLLKLAAPLQSWGAASKFSRRTTNREPTKSGVIGLAAAALGYRRDDPLDELQQLAFAVRVDQVGKIVRDFHTAHTFGEKNKQAFLSHRYYLSDAVFLAGLEGPRELLERIEAAIMAPVFPLFLGRRSCPPTGAIICGIREQPLFDALRDADWAAAVWYMRRQPPEVWLEIVRDAAHNESGAFEIRDFPLTFAQSHRQHTFRSAISDARAVRKDNPLSFEHERGPRTGTDAQMRTSAPIPDAKAGFQPNEQTQTEHDPFEGLEVGNVPVTD